MTYPIEIRNAMRECILKIFWPRKDIINFFKNNNCSNSDLNSVSSYGEMSWKDIIDTVFQNLANKSDKGIGPFRAMLKTLIEWETFDSYHFKRGNLNAEDAKCAISTLKNIQEIRDHKLKEELKKREEQQLKRQQPSKTFNELKEAFFSLFQGKINNQQRGYAFEKTLLELSKLSELTITKSFRVQGEQIDGAIKYDGEHYIIEAKWQDQLIASEGLYHFAYKVEGKMHGRGIFFSINGYSKDAVSALTNGKSKNTILVDGMDLIAVLEERISFEKMLDMKIKAAQTTGHIFIDPLTEKPKNT